MQRVVIIGAGQAGCSAAFALRKRGFDGEIILLGEEPDPPYQRPPLSKAYLLGDMARERLYLKPPGAYTDAGIDLRTGCEAIAIDAQQMRVETAQGPLTADAIILATGSKPIKLPEAVTGGLAGIHYVRGLADIDAIRTAIPDCKNAVIIGGGYIGLEAAAVATKVGLNATVVEMAPRILQRVASRETSDAMRALHAHHGVTILENVGLALFLGDGSVNSAVLADGTELPCDLAIVGVGIRPDIALAQAAGLRIENGIWTDARGQTSAPGIWAVGDCASFPHTGAPLRLESVPHAIDHAETVAANVLGARTDYTARPWFWSDQFDVKLQIAGLNTGYDQVVTRPGGKPWSRSHWYFAAGRLVAVDALNAPRDYMSGKRWIEAGQTPDRKRLADPAVDLKTLV